MYVDSERMALLMRFLHEIKVQLNFSSRQEKKASEFNLATENLCSIINRSKILSAWGVVTLLIKYTVKMSNKINNKIMYMGLPLVSQSRYCTPPPVPSTAGEGASCDRHVILAVGSGPAPLGLPHALAFASLAAPSVKVWESEGVGV